MASQSQSMCVTVTSVDASILVLPMCMVGVSVTCEGWNSEIWFVWTGWCSYAEHFANIVIHSEAFFFYFFQFLNFLLLCILITVFLCVFQILSSVLSSVMEYDRSVYNKLWVVLCDTLTAAPLGIKSQVFELTASILKKVGFTMDVKVRLEHFFIWLSISWSVSNKWWCIGLKIFKLGFFIHVFSDTKLYYFHNSCPFYFLYFLFFSYIQADLS